MDDQPTATYNQMLTETRKLKRESEEKETMATIDCSWEQTAD